MENEVSFNEKFEALGEYYRIESPKEIRKQISENENIFIFLDEIKPYLEKSFDDAVFALEMNFEPEMDDDYIILRVNVSLDRFHNGARADIDRLQNELWPLRRKNNVCRECLLMLGFDNV